MSCWGVQGDAVPDGSCHSITDLGVMPSGIVCFACGGHMHVRFVQAHDALQVMSFILLQGTVVCAVSSGPLD